MPKLRPNQRQQNASLTLVEYPWQFYHFYSCSAFTCFFFYAKQFSIASFSRCNGRPACLHWNGIKISNLAAGLLHKFFRRDYLGLIFVHTTFSNWEIHPDWARVHVIEENEGDASRSTYNLTLDPRGRRKRRKEGTR